MSIRVFAVMLALAPSVAFAQVRGEAPPPGLTVQGSATVQTLPDRATISLTLRAEGETADAASSALADIQKKVMGGIASLDRSTVYRTGDVRMAAIRRGDCPESTPSPDLMIVNLEGGRSEKDKGPCRVAGYAASIEATAELRAIDKAGTAIGLANRLGAASASLDGFGLRDPGAAQRAATAAAIADARARGEALATASGSKLGPVVSIVSVNEAAPLQMLAMEQFVAEPLPAVMVPVVIDVSPKPVETSAQVLVIYALRP